MSLLLYGIVMEDSQLDIDPNMQLVKEGALVAIVTICEDEVSREPSIVLAFGEQVMQIHQQTTVIPMRYGSVLKNKDAVRQHLLEHQIHYQSCLIELNDCEELGIRLSLELLTDHVVSLQQPVSGHRYLQERKRVYEVPVCIEQQAEKINNVLIGLYRQHNVTFSVFNGRQTYLLSYLVPRSELDIFRQRLHELRNVIGDIGSMSGPWPPYNFVSEFLQ